MKYLFLTLSIFFSTAILAQKQELFSVESFIELVKQHHPIAKVASIQVQKAEAELLAAKGAFDPTLSYTFDSKTFDKKNYFYYNNPELKVPTPIGVDIKTGVESNGGQFLTEESTKGRSSYLGVEVALAKGLVIDKRRAALQQAKLLIGQNEQEKLKIINDLLLDAYTTYWQWTGSYQLYQVFRNFLNISNDRLRLIRIGFTNGDRSLMDTVEAFTQVQNFQLLQLDALQKLNNAGIELSNFLWLQNDSAYLLPNTFVPDTTQFAFYNIPKNLDAIIAQSTIENPALKAFTFKLNSLEVERKLKFQSLLPVVNFRANLLNQDYNVFKGVNGAFFENNNKWGIDFKLPLFLREGRGEYAKTKLKLKETNLELVNKRWEVENKIRFYYNENILLQQQIATGLGMFKNYNFLLLNEDLRFKQGESSLFILNSRENKVMESLQKIIELRIKYFKSKYTIDWAAGLLR